MDLDDNKVRYYDYMFCALCAVQELYLENKDPSIERKLWYIFSHILIAHLCLFNKVNNYTKLPFYSGKFTDTVNGLLKGPTMDVFKFLEKTIQNG